MIAVSETFINMTVIVVSVVKSMGEGVKVREVVVGNGSGKEEIARLELTSEKCVKEGNFEDKGYYIKLPTLTVQDIDLTKLKARIEKINKENEEERLKAKKIEEVKNKIAEIVESKEFLRAEFYSESATIKAGIYKDNRFKVIEEFKLYYNDDAVKHIESYDFTDVLIRYVEKLENENKQLKEQIDELRNKLNATKEELIKEMYVNNELITITDECEIELKVIRVDDEGYY